MSEQACERASSRLQTNSVLLSATWDRRKALESSHLDSILVSVATALESVMRNKTAFLDAKRELLATLSPAATLRRGYSITRVDGKAVTRADDVEKGALLETMLADGKIISIKQ